LERRRAVICVVTAPIDLANYIDIWNLRRRHPGESVCHIKWGDLSVVKPTETLYLLAHGSPDAIENHGPDDLAKLLVAKGLKKPIKKIKLLVCASGIVGRSGGPYCQRLADALVKRGGPATVVIGMDGETAVTDATGTTYAKDIRQSNYPNYGEFRAKHLGTCVARDNEAQALPYGSETEILKNAESLHWRSRDVFLWLYDNNKLYTKPKVGGKTYGIPGQKF
jgi:hypothetical protein